MAGAVALATSNSFTSEAAQTSYVTLVNTQLRKGQIHIVAVLTRFSSFPVQPTLAGHSETYAVAYTLGFRFAALPAMRLTIFRCQASADTLGLVTASFGAETEQQCSIYELVYDGCAQGANGGNAFRQSVSAAADSGTSRPVTLGTINAGNAALAFIGMNNGGTVTQATGWTKVGQVGLNPTLGVEWVNDNAHLTPDWSGGNNTQWGVIAFELVSASNVLNKIFGPMTLVASGPVSDVGFLQKTFGGMSLVGAGAVTSIPSMGQLGVWPQLTIATLLEFASADTGVTFFPSGNVVMTGGKTQIAAVLVYRGAPVVVAPTLSGATRGWTEILTASYGGAGNNARLSVFSAFVATSNTAPVTADFGVQIEDGVSIAVYEFPGHVNVVQKKSAVTTVDDPSLSVTLDAPCSAGNSLLSFFGNEQTLSVDPRAGWTEVTDLLNGNAGDLSVQFKAAGVGETAASTTTTIGAATGAVGIVLEIAPGQTFEPLALTAAGKVTDLPLPSTGALTATFAPMTLAATGRLPDTPSVTAVQGQRAHGSSAVGIDTRTKIERL